MAAILKFVLFLFGLQGIIVSATSDIGSLGASTTSRNGPLYVLVDPPRTEYGIKGDDVVISIPLSDDHEEISCKIQNAQGIVIDVRPELITAREDIRVVEDSRHCAVTIGPLDETNAGDWLMMTTNLDSLKNQYERTKMHTVRVIDVPRNSLADSNSIHARDDRSEEEPAYHLDSAETSITAATGTSTELLLHIVDGHTIVSCYIQKADEDFIQLMPDNKSDRDDLSLDESFENGCKVVLGPIGTENVGHWTLKGLIYDSIGLLYEKRVPYDVQSFDAAFPKTKNARIRRGLARNYEVFEEVDESVPVAVEETIETKLKSGESKVLSLPSNYHSIACYIQTNTLEVIEFKPKSNNTNTNMSLEPGSLRSGCRVVIDNFEENLAGSWMVFSSGLDQFGNIIQRRRTYELIFDGGNDVEVTGPLGVFPSDHITLYSGQDLYIRLNDTVRNLNSCKLHSNSGELDYQADIRYPKSCGMVIMNVQMENSGIWQLEVQSEDAVNTVQVAVEVLEFETSNANLTFELGQSVFLTLGPEETSYCSVKNPQNVEIYNGFSRCVIDLERAKSEDAGIWKMSVGLKGSLIAMDLEYHVEVLELEDAVSSRLLGSLTTFEDQRLLRCTIRSNEDLKTCQFRRPDSSLFIVNEGLGVGRYAAQSAGVVANDDGSRNISCGLLIQSPQDEDFGTWQCSLETNESIFNGFIHLPSTNDIVNAADDAEHISLNLRSSKMEQSVVSGSSATLQCRVDTRIEYCWFQAPNATIFTVQPGIASNIGTEYAGAGFDFGDCSMRVLNVDEIDNGLWSCNVGVTGKRDLSLKITLNVLETPLVVMADYNTNAAVMVLEAKMFDGTPLSSCRIVSPDGRGYSIHATDKKISFSQSKLSEGICQVELKDLKSNHVGTWTVLAQRVGENREIMGNTQYNMSNAGSVYEKYMILLIMLLIFLSMNVLLVTLFLNNTKTRTWAYERANYVRGSLRLPKPRGINPPPPYTEVHA